MGKRIAFILLAAMVLLSGCCCPLTAVRRVVRNIDVQGSGVLVTQDMNLSGFTRLVISHSFVADVKQSGTYSVVITADDNLVGHLDVSKRGDTLYVGLDNVSLFGDATLRAEITMPTLEGLESSGASKVTATGFRSSAPLDLEASGASSIEGEIDSGDVHIRVSGASSVTLDGSGGNGDIGVSGASRARLQGFALQDADVEASGASSATVDVAGRLNAEASGASSILYVGNPQLGRIEQSGASSVKPK
jgi:hypothetical protein